MVEEKRAVSWGTDDHPQVAVRPVHVGPLGKQHGLDLNGYCESRIEACVFKFYNSMSLANAYRVFYALYHNRDCFTHIYGHMLSEAIR